MSGETYRITVKGELLLEFGDTAAERIWATLLQIGHSHLAAQNKQGTPCIVLHDEGGEVIPVIKQQTKGKA